VAQQQLILQVQLETMSDPGPVRQSHFWNWWSLICLQAYLCTLTNHPALSGSRELRCFLTFEGELQNCQQWQQMVQRPAPMDVLLGLLRAQGSSSNSSSTGGAGSGSSREEPGGNPAAPGSAAAAAAAAAGGSGGMGNMMLRMKHSLMSVVQPRSRPEAPPDERKLLQAKEWLK
jgi:hypothetical protein